MSGFLVFLGLTGLILLPVVTFGLVMSYVFPSKPYELSKFEIDKIIAKNNGWGIT